MTRVRQIVNPTKMGPVARRLIGTTDIDGNGTSHEIADVDPIVLFDYVEFNSAMESEFRPHPHVGLTAMSFMPTQGSFNVWDSVNGDEDTSLHPGGLYYVHAGLPAFHHERVSDECAAEKMDIEFIQLVWNATDEDSVETVVIQPEDVPVVTTENATVRVLAGELFGVQSVQPFTHRNIVYAYVQVNPGRSLELPVPVTMRGVVFPIEGNLEVNDVTINQQQMMILGEQDHQLLISNTDKNNVARFIIAAGEPLNKPFCKLLGLGGFIIGETEAELRSAMKEFSLQAEQLEIWGNNT